jgi:hypothetical protein
MIGTGFDAGCLSFLLFAQKKVRTKSAGKIPQGRDSARLAMANAYVDYVLSFACNIPI